MSASVTVLDVGLSKAERVYSTLRRQIRELVLKPGTLLRKEEIALALGVSRGPVSEAITRLADEALVDVFRQHGSFVAPIRAQDVRESLFIRTALEVDGVRRVAQFVQPELIEALEENLAAQTKALKINDMTTFHDLDEAMHAKIFAAVGSPRAERLLHAARAPLDRPRRLALPEDGRPEATFAEHRRLVDAIASRDPELAAAAMRAHLSMVARAVEASLAQLEADASASEGGAAPR